MKNFWISRHNNKQSQKKIEETVQKAVRLAIQKKVRILMGKMPWNKP